ncbi:hypothetical protein U9M48_023167 [Paspalum notatum var. saurae]|uniref:Uncharacterized protein n=1 Tax=Paspalum notatum var. saurae TaxID=547442 RepID=A0AAQ3TL49_PASNO
MSSFKVPVRHHLRCILRFLYFAAARWVMPSIRASISVLTSYVARHTIFAKTISIHVLTYDEMAIFALISVATTFIAFPEHIAMPVADMPKLLQSQQTPALPPPPCSQEL